MELLNWVFSFLFLLHNISERNSAFFLDTFLQVQLEQLVNRPICYIRCLKMVTGYVVHFSRCLTSSMVTDIESQCWAPLLVSWCTGLYTVEINLYWGACKQDSLSKLHVMALCMVRLKWNFWVYFRLLGSCFFPKW